MKKYPYKKVRKTEDQLIFLGDEKGLKDFEKNYLEVREKEGRLFSDQLVEQLPYLSKAHPLQSEWLHRATSAGMFIKYLKSKKELNNILDLGCGNGWFTKQIVSILPKADVFGLDVNVNELQQAARIFSSPRTHFLYGDVFQDIFIPDTFDLIVLNSAVQYFPDIKILVNRLLELLTENGEIHILDSPFYASSTAQNEARKRSTDYFLKMGVVPMGNHYYHHMLHTIQDYSPAFLYHPGKFNISLLSLLGKKPALFPWVCIQK